MEEAPSMSIRQLDHEMHVSKDTVWRLLKGQQYILPSNMDTSNGAKRF